MRLGSIRCLISASILRNAGEVYLLYSLSIDHTQVVELEGLRLWGLRPPLQKSPPRLF